MTMDARGGSGGIGGIATMVLLGIGAIIGLSILFGCYYTVDQSERAVVLRNGAFTDVAGPGWHFKAPWIDTVYKIDLQTHTHRYPDKGGTFEAYSADSQPAKLVVSVTLHVAPDKVQDMYARFRGDMDAAIARIISPHVNEKVKNVFGQYNAARAISARSALNTDASKALTESLAYDPVFVIESVQIEDISFSQDYIKSVEARMKAEVEVQQFQQNLAKEKIAAQIAVTQAQAIADSTLARAEADAKSTVLRGDAEAKAILAQATALGQNPALIQLEQARKWNGTLPTTMLPGAAVPMLTLK